MASGEFGGDHSVKWNIDVGQLRPGSSKSETRDGSFHQEGIDETDDGQEFTISIKLPKAARKGDKDLAAFLKLLLSALKHPVRNRIVFKIPIEKGNQNRKTGRVDQIRISWNSSKRPRKV